MGREKISIEIVATGTAIILVMSRAAALGEGESISNRRQS